MTPKNRIIPVFVPHLGCPNHCVFCNQRKISGSLFPADAETVQKTLIQAEKVTPSGELAFYGGSFTRIPKAVQISLLEAAQPFRENGFLRSIRVSTRPDGIDPEKLELLREFGVETIEIGAQSMNDRVLLVSGRGHTADDTRRAAAMIQGNGFHLILQMMTGLPGSDAETDIRTAKAIAELQPDGVRIYPTVILRGSELERLWRAGCCRAHTVTDAVAVCSEIVPMFRSREIPILRLGLNPTEDLSGGEVVAGAYHPALGELVYSRVFLELARRELRALGHWPKRAELLVHPSDVSKMTGQKRMNLLCLQMEFGIRDLRVKSGAFPPGTVAIREIV